MNVQSSQLAKPCLGILFIWVLSIQAGIVTRSPVFHLPFVGKMFCHVYLVNKWKKMLVKYLLLFV